MLIFKALACDYDGTLASEDRLGPDALAALAKAREAGLRVILVTGRTFFELTRARGLSFHDVLALGDAENDLDLFDACGWAGCPGSAVPELMRRADWTFPGEDGAAIARAIVGPLLNGLLPLDRSARQRIALGWTAATAASVSLPARGINVLIHGDPLSGKSWLAGALVERLHERRYALCVLDPEGE